MRGATQQAGDYMGAFDAARREAARRFGWQESSPAVEAALGGAQPDKFVQQFVINGSVRDARTVAQNVDSTAVRDSIVAHLKSRALTGADDEVGKFSQSAYNKALREIGEEKLRIFFDPAEIGQLRALGRVASYAQVQPVGSAVNNSNSGALGVGAVLDALRGLGATPLVGRMVSGAATSIQQRQAQNAGRGLLAPQPAQPAGAGLLLPGLAYGGLLAAP
jgi:hypothetical protein